MANLFENEVTSSFCKNCRVNYYCIFRKHELQNDCEFTIPEIRENCILFLNHGSLEIFNGNQQNLVIIDSGMVFIPPFTAFRARTMNNQMLITLTFDKNFNICQKLSLNANSIPLEKPHKELKVMELKDPVYKFLKGISSYLNDNLYCKGLFYLKQVEFFYVMKTYYSNEENIRFFSSILCKDKDFKLIVLENYKKINRVAELAGKCNMSVKTFTRRFKDNFEETPYQWLIKQKVKDIEARLALPDIQIKDIAREFGFNSTSQFTHYCKKQINDSPQSLRQKLKIRNLL